MSEEIIKDCPNVHLNDWGGYSCMLYDPYITDDKKKIVKYGTCKANKDCRFKQLKRLEQDFQREQTRRIELENYFMKLERENKELLEECMEMVNENYASADWREMKDIKAENEKLKQSFEEIKLLAQKECQEECGFHFCEGITEHSTCVIYKILEKCK